MAEENKSKLDPTLIAEIEARLRGIAGLIGPECPKGVGFVLLMFDFGASGWASYVSNCHRADMIKALREAADVLERQGDRPPVLGQQ